nr:MAG TPA: hypothetical protein [Caudoviricetes sp.]DAS18579.1 MAG TPA: hypothetical protein [Caudoviricetes sp.]
MPRNVGNSCIISTLLIHLYSYTKSASSLC